MIPVGTVIPVIEAVVEEINQGPEPEPGHLGVTHLAKAAVVSKHVPRHVSKPFSSHLQGQVNVLGKDDSGIETAQLPEFFPVEEQEHAGAETQEASKSIQREEIPFIQEDAALAQDIGGDRVEPMVPQVVQRPAHQIRADDDVGVHEKHIARVGQLRPPIAAYGWEAPLDDLQVEPVAKRLHHRPRFVGALRVGHQDAGVRHGGVVLADEGLQQ